MDQAGLEPTSILLPLQPECCDGEHGQSWIAAAPCSSMVLGMEAGVAHSGSLFRVGHSEEVPGARSTGLELHFAGRKGLILHGHHAAAAQHPDSQCLVLLMRLLIPPVHHRRVEGRDQCDLGDNRQTGDPSLMGDLPCSPQAPW